METPDNGVIFQADFGVGNVCGLCTTLLIISEKGVIELRDYDPLMSQLIRQPLPALLHEG